MRGCILVQAGLPQHSAVQAGTQHAYQLQANIQRQHLSSEVQLLPKQAVCRLHDTDSRQSGKDMCPCRDIVEALRLEGCASVTDFEWQRQLRFECDPISEEIAIRQVS